MAKGFQPAGADRYHRGGCFGDFCLDGLELLYEEYGKDILGIFNMLSSIGHHWKNRWLSARINEIYTNESDLDEKRLLGAHRKTLRKLIGEEW